MYAVDNSKQKSSFPKGILQSLFKSTAKLLCLSDGKHLLSLFGKLATRAISGHSKSNLL